MTTHGWVALACAVVLAVGWATVASAADPAVASGPELGGPAVVSERVPTAEEQAAGSLPEPSPQVVETREVLGSEAGAPANDNPIPTEVRVEASERVSRLPPTPVVASRSRLPEPSLKPFDLERERSEQLELVAQQADRRTRHGLELASRGAYFAARSEFFGSLRLVAQGLDAEHKTNEHSRALASAVTALKESEDFLPDQARLGAEADVPALIAIHTTSVMKEEAKDATALAALRNYLTFAQRQLAKAAGSEVAGSMALQSLGKLHAAMAQKRYASVIAPESKAMVFYQAALLSYPNNYMAANDLGVLMAQCGRYADAKVMFERSVAVRPQSTSWQNLAVVYRQMQEPLRAERAASQAAVVRQNELAQRRMSATASNDVVQWVDSQTFGQNALCSLMGPAGATPTSQPTATLSQSGENVNTGNRTPMPRSAVRATASSSGWPAWIGTPSASQPSPTAAPTPAAAQRMSRMTSSQQR